MTRIRLLTLAIVAIVAFGLGACGSRTEGLDRTQIPDELKSDYDLFARKCSKCHSLARPLQSGITDDEQWVNYVNRMRRQPGSGISYEDQGHILAFLRYYAAELRRKDAEKRGVVATPPPIAPIPHIEEPKDGG